MVLKQRFFLHCANFNTQRETLFDKITTIDVNILTENENSIANTLLFGKHNNENSFNKAMLKAPIEFILPTERLNKTISLMLIKNYTLSFFFLF